MRVHELRPRPGAVRFAHASGHYDQTVAFFRDLVGLPVIDEFSGSFGEDGTIFGLPHMAVQLEVVCARSPDDAPGWFDQLVLYLDDPAAVGVATTALAAQGNDRVDDPHPCWADRGAVVYRDPDGRDLVVAPWVYGPDPEPSASGGQQRRLG